jgi:hypothetical protein
MEVEGGASQARVFYEAAPIHPSTPTFEVSLRLRHASAVFKAIVLQANQRTFR